MAEYRLQLRECRQFLESDLFKRVASGDEDVAAWEGPTGWRVELTPSQSRDALAGIVKRPDGTTAGATTCADAGWLDEVLP